MMVIPPNRVPPELGPRYGVKGFIAGVIFGTVIGVLAFLFFESYWCFLVIPMAGMVGYVTRSIVRIKLLPENVMW